MSVRPTTRAELDALVARADALLAEDRRGVPDLGGQGTRRVAALVSVPTEPIFLPASRDRPADSTQAWHRPLDVHRGLGAPTHQLPPSTRTRQLLDAGETRYCSVCNRRQGSPGHVKPTQDGEHHRRTTMASR